jgi:hypothetical protein
MIYPILLVTGLLIYYRLYLLAVVCLIGGILWMTLRK